MRKFRFEKLCAIALVFTFLLSSALPVYGFVDNSLGYFNENLYATNDDIIFDIDSIPVGHSSHVIVDQNGEELLVEMELIPICPETGNPLPIPFWQQNDAFISAGSWSWWMQANRANGTWIRTEKFFDAFWVFNGFNHVLALTPRHRGSFASVVWNANSVWGPTIVGGRVELTMINTITVLEYRIGNSFYLHRYYVNLISFGNGQIRMTGDLQTRRI